MPATLVVAIYIVSSAVILSMHYWLMPTVYVTGAFITIISIARILAYVSQESHK
tara:strand:+ start:50 stop:211 length:162 start_codon:yes stop_codon:yes gene_type:complete